MSEVVTHVVKLGGSLLDLPDLRDRLQRWRDAEPSDAMLFVVGGGRAADVVRELDATHALGEAAAHDLAIQAMALNARVVATVMGWPMVPSWDQPGVIEPIAAVASLESRGGTVHRRWSFTSDSIAASLAAAAGPARLTLLKSALPDAVTDVADAAAAGLVDADFREACAGVARIDLVNLRATPMRTIRLR